MDLVAEICKYFELSDESLKIIQDCADLALLTGVSHFDAVTLKALALDEQLENIKHRETMRPIETQISDVSRQLEVEMEEIRSLEKLLSEVKPSMASKEELQKIKAEAEVKIKRAHDKMQTETAELDIDLDALMQKVSFIEGMSDSQ